MYDVDLLAAAWGWTQDEIAFVLRLDPDEMRALRNHEQSIDGALLERVEHLKRVHLAIWQALPPGAWSRWWRQPNSAFAGHSALTVALRDSDGLDRVIAQCASATWWPPSGASRLLAKQVTRCLRGIEGRGSVYAGREGRDLARR